MTVQNHGTTETISVESDQVDLDIEVKNTQDTDQSIKNDQNPL